MNGCTQQMRNLEGNLNEGCSMEHQDARRKFRAQKKRRKKSKRSKLLIPRQDWGGLSTSWMDHSVIRRSISKTARAGHWRTTFRGHEAELGMGLGWGLRLPRVWNLLWKKGRSSWAWGYENRIRSRSGPQRTGGGCASISSWTSYRDDDGSGRA